MGLEGIIAVLSGVATAIFGGANAIRFVHEGERGVRMRFGRAVRHKKGRFYRLKSAKKRAIIDARIGQVKVVGLGWFWLWPVLERLERTHVRQEVLNCGDQQITLKDDTVFNVDAVLIRRVKDTPNDLEKALFEVNGLKETVRMYCIGVLREVVQAMTYRELIETPPENISSKLQEKILDRLESWGLELVSFKLGDLSPYGETIRLVQAAASAKSRAQALKAAAKVLDVDPKDLDPTLAAALIGTPVSVALGAIPKK